jgi:4-alpha-glucanotransferase
LIDLHYFISAQNYHPIPFMETPLFNWLDNRAAGLLLHPTSLPGRHGIGTLGGEMPRFIDFLKAAGFKYWQILPPGPTGYGDCPYSSFSAMAGNPYMIDFDCLVELGLLQDDELLEISRLPSDHVDFGMLYRVKWPVLRLAFRRFSQGRRDNLPGYGSFKAFKADKASWLEPFAFFMALKAAHGGKPWYEWDLTLRSFSRIDAGSLPREIRDEAEAQRFYQYLFFGQWAVVRKLAADAGVSIVGDMPFYVSRDSADVWGSPEAFDLNEKLDCNAVAGVPPDYFSKDGQLWGNPLYNWDKLAASGYEWWMKRLEAAFELFDVVRLDHFRAFHDYWKIPADSKTACVGEWILGPDMDFFKAVKERFGNPRLIAEDLGFIDDGVRLLLKNTGLPGMGVLQFGYDCDGGNLNLPHNMRANQALYAGTHDNDTTRGWYDGLPSPAQDQLRRYLRIDGRDVSWDMIRECYRGVPNLAIICAQDVLSLDSHARMNIPGTSMGNWQWRMTQRQFEELFVHAAYLNEIGWLYGRIRKPKKLPVQSKS